MLTFACDSCTATLFFENDTCLACGHKVGFRSDDQTMCTVESATAGGLMPCRNWTEYAACNWFTPATAGSELVTAGAAAGYTPAVSGPTTGGFCVACSLNEVVPDLADPQRRTLWIDTERAKRRLIFTLLEIGLPLLGLGDKQALSFRLLADERADTGEVDPPREKEPIYIGHDNGRLTLNVIEADDVLRGAIAKRLNERYRTMLGHLRHEIGHYYWYLLVDGMPIQEPFRGLFGDERAGYDAALNRYYDAGPPPDWQQTFVSPYASMHPWEDFAETWAHYLHIVDTLETASSSALTLGARAVASPLPLGRDRPFDSVLADWAPLTVCLNQLNRSMGMRDAYPFAIPPRVAEKLAFVHDLCRAATSATVSAQQPRPAGYAALDAS
jgi:hypothetical protein